jgi:phage/plasmid-like protein (TIGR03299 family)
MTQKQDPTFGNLRIGGHGKFGIDIDPSIGKNAPAILDAIGANYKVEKVKIYTVDANDMADEIPNAMAQRRADNGRVLSLVSGNRYNVVQPVEYAEAALASLATVGLAIDRAWNLGGGRALLFGAKLPPEYTLVVGEGDITVNYLYVGGGYNKKLASFAFTQGERIACLNQLAVALARGSKDGRLFSVPHQTIFDGNVLAAALGLFGKELAVQSKVFNQLAGYRVTKDKVDQYFAKLLNIKDDSKLSKITENKLQALTTTFHEGAGSNLKSARGTAYGLLNAITNFVDHQAATKDTDGDGAAKSRAFSATFGGGAVLKQKALRLAMQMADVDDSVLLAA